jgi:NADH-quinone oxidoreductase subunit J
MEIIDFILLCCLVLMSLWTVMTARLIKSVVGLALTSAVLSVIIFRLDSPLAAVFELSVCAGLISVIFITTVSFTQRLTKEEVVVRRKERYLRFWLLPFILLIAAALLFYYIGKSTHAVGIVPSPQAKDVRYILWHVRKLDILGQIAVLLCAAVGVVALFKEEKK